MRLMEVWRADPERTFELFSEFPADENGFENQAAGMDRERFAVYVHELEEQSVASVCSLAGCRAASTFSSMMRVRMWESSICGIA